MKVDIGIMYVTKTYEMAMGALCTWHIYGNGDTYCKHVVGRYTINMQVYTINMQVYVSFSY